jgi:RNA polymerase sigma-70 factor (ECF subfamily)
VEPKLRSAEQEFEQFFVGVVDRVKALALRITGDLWDAEDVAVETLARAYARWDRLAGVAWRDGWVLKVGGNLAIDLVRRRRSVPIDLVGEHDRPGGQAFRPVAASDHAGWTLEQVTLASALRKLPRREREIAVLIGLCDCTHEHAASVLGISVGSSKTYFHRAVGHLRVALATGDRGGEVSDGTGWLSDGPG